MFLNKAILKYGLVLDGKIRTMVIVLTILLMGCGASDRCGDITVSNSVLLTVQLQDANGINVFGDTNFDVSSLAILSAANNQEVPFSVDQNNGQNIIRFEYVGNVTFKLNNETKATLSFTNTVSQTDKCGALTAFSFTAQSNGQIVCECNAQQSIPVKLSL